MPVTPLLRRTALPLARAIATASCSRRRVRIRLVSGVRSKRHPTNPAADAGCHQNDEKRGVLRLAKP